VISESEKAEIEAIKKVIVKVLKNDASVTLAQLPLLLRKELGRPANIKDLGYAKFKDFLSTNMADSIAVETCTKTNQLVTRLMTKEEQKKYAESKEEEEKIAENKF